MEQFRECLRSSTRNCISRAKVGKKMISSSIASGSWQSSNSHGAQISVTKGIVEGKRDDKNVLPKRR